jgi:WD40-like Beta Propeller Repeat
MRRLPRNRWFTLASAFVFHVFVAAVWLVVATLAVAIAVGANPRSEKPSEAAFLTALALAGALWLAGIVLIVWRWRAGQSLLGVPIVWAGAASVAGLMGLVFYPEPSPSPPISSPQGKASPSLRALGKLAFAIPSGQGSASDIFVMNADGTGLANLTRNEATDDRAPAWSPNGTEIAFSSDGGEAHARDVFAINVVTRALRNLTNGAGANYDPAWSPDGQKIAFASERWDDDAGAYDDHYEIYVRRRSTRVAKLTRNVADDVRPVWSASGARIAFNSRRDGNWETYAMNADGSVQRNLSDHAADDEDPAWSQTGGRSPSSATGAGALQPMYSSWTPMAGPSGSSRATRAISRGLCGRRTAERSPSSIGATERSTL